MAHESSLFPIDGLPLPVLAELHPFVLGLAVVFFVVVSLLMMLVVLIQKPQGGGLSGAFGAGSPEGSGQTAFGTKTGDVLTTATIGIFVVFIGTAIALNYMIGPPVAPVQDVRVSPATTTLPIPGSATGSQPGNFTIDITDPADAGNGGGSTP